MNILGLCNHRIRRLKTEEDFRSFEKAFADDMSYSVPASFLKKGKAWGVWRKGCIGRNEPDNWVAGYGLITEHPLRSLQEIPDYKMIPDWNKRHIGEFTAFWVSRRYMDTKYFGFFFTAHMILNTLLHPSKYYAYSYPISEVKLGEYYAKGHPLRLYSGPINRLEGHGEDPEPENVELLTTWGIWKIFFHRTRKYAFVGLKNLLGLGKKKRKGEKN